MGPAYISPITMESPYIPLTMGVAYIFHRAVRSAYISLLWGPHTFRATAGSPYISPIMGSPYIPNFTMGAPNIPQLNMGAQYTSKKVRSGGKGRERKRDA